MAKAAAQSVVKVEEMMEEDDLVKLEDRVMVSEEDVVQEHDSEIAEVEEVDVGTG